MSRFAFAALALLCVSAVRANAQSAAIEREVKAAPGKDVRVGIYTDIRPDCTSGPLPAIRLVTPPAHGAVKRQARHAQGHQSQAMPGHRSAGVHRLLSRRRWFYSGADEFVLEIASPGGRKELQHFRVTVSSNPGGGQGI
jgi:hypothetical protein